MKTVLLASDHAAQRVFLSAEQSSSVELRVFAPRQGCCQSNDRKVTAVLPRVKLRNLIANCCESR